MCEYCYQSFGHAPGCPMHHPTFAELCPLCDEPIYSGESIIVTEQGHIHYNCFKDTSTVDLLDFLGLETTTA